MNDKEQVIEIAARVCEKVGSLAVLDPDYKE